ncbi:MAG: outer membrane lipoprotein LolB [Sterolibacterium sp.]|jgi:outer membrane lipoprotein LolB|nr:outer membrane lipoprotein LolB [Sterolibacterium sp.]
MLCSTLRLILTLIGLGVACLLPGCASLGADAVRVSGNTLPLQTLRSSRADITGFELEGRISVRQGEKRHIVNLSWHHEAAQDQLLLTTPLGQGLAELTRDAQGAHLRLSDRRSFAAADPEALAEQMFGIRLPLSVLSRWLVGQVPPAREPGQNDALGRPQWRKIDGWRMRYEYADSENPAADALPVLFEMQQNAEDIDVRLKIDQWQVMP